MHSVILRRMKLLIPTGKLGKSNCKYERMFFRVYEGALRQQHKEQVSVFCHSNVAVLGFGVWEQISLLVIAALLSLTSVYAEVGARFHLPLTKGEGAHVALYVNGTLFVSVLHMSITPSFNPSLCLGSGTLLVACVQGLAARVAVTALIYSRPVLQWLAALNASV